MKYLFTLLIFSSFYFTNGQSPLETLLENNWRLIEYDDGTKLGFYDFLNNPELDQISLDFFIKDDMVYYQTQVCRTKTGLVGEIVEDGPVYYFEFGTYEIEGNECIDPDSQEFETAYFGHIYDEFSYWFYFIENEDGTLLLNLSSSSFCTAVFTNEILSNEEISSQSFSIYPNPVLDKLTIENTKLEIEKIKITEASGKQIFQKNTNAPKIEIDFTHFPKGVYFITIESKGKTKTEKVIKK